MIEPLGHRILVRPFQPEDLDPRLKAAKALGIQLPESQQKAERAGVDQGIVLSIGDTAFKDYGSDPWCKIGDHIAYARHAGKWIKDPDTNEELLVINDEDVVACITKKDI